MTLFATITQALADIAPVRDVPILQPADPYLESAGEEMRRRIFITQAGNGATLCMRPEFTIPICMQFVASGETTARASYGGTVFRQGREGAAEFRQAGLEDLGRADRAAADADALADMLSVLATADRPATGVELGDQALFAGVVEALGLPAAIGERLLRAFGSPDVLDAQLARMTAQQGAVQDREEDRLARAGDADALVALVEARMAAANLSPRAGRSPQQIAARMIDRAQLAAFTFEGAHARALRDFLAITVPLPQAGDALEAFARTHGLSLSLDAFAERAERLSACAAPITYRAQLGRSLGYYTGLVFEVMRGDVTVGGGGRYDALCGLLGARDTVPAVGFSIALDRLEAAR